MATNQARIYKVINHRTGITRLINAMNKWQATEFAARDDYTCEAIKAADAFMLGGKNIKIESALIKKK